MEGKAWTPCSSFFCAREEGWRGIKLGGPRGYAAALNLRACRVAAASTAKPTA
jgi:hypothetical protein